MSVVKCPNVFCTFEGTQDEVDEHFVYMESRGLHDTAESETEPLF